MTQLTEQLAAIVGDAAVITDPQEVAPYATDWRKRYFGKPLAVVKPASTAEVAAVVKLVRRDAHGGRAAGRQHRPVRRRALPDACAGAQIVLKLSRMNRVRAVDAVNNTITVEAGCVLANLQQAAAAADRLFPLSLAAEGSCEIGGNLSTNAGGTAVLRYGNARDLVLGLEVVLPDGQIWDGLRGLRKDNTGYDLKHLFVGAEGTLGIITAAVLKLYPRPRARATALVALESPAKALRTAVAHAGRVRRPRHRLRADVARCASRWWPSTFRRRALPFAQAHPQYVLLELSDTASAAKPGRRPARSAGRGERSAAWCSMPRWPRARRRPRALWALRENIPEAQVHEGKQIKHDVSVPISRIAEFIAVTDAELQRAFPGVRMVTFGHLGDGNLHYNIAPAGRRRRGRVHGARGAR